MISTAADVGAIAPATFANFAKISIRCWLLVYLRALECPPAGMAGNAISVKISASPLLVLSLATCNVPRHITGCQTHLVLVRIGSPLAPPHELGLVLGVDQIPVTVVVAYEPLPHTQTCLSFAPASVPFVSGVSQVRRLRSASGRPGSARMHPIIRDDLANFAKKR